MEFKDKFSAGMLKLGQFGGKTYTIPFAPDVSVLLYNKDHYIKAGLNPEAPPKDWNGLIKYSQALPTKEH